MNAAELRDPLAALVASLTQELVSRLKTFGDRCRNYAIQQADNPEFVRSLANQSTSLNGRPPAVAERKDPANDDRQEVRPRPPRQTFEDAPMKKPRNAYNLFVASESVKIKEQNPHMRAPDIVRVAAERYNNMTAQQKRPYMQKFEQAKRIYEEQQMDMSRTGSTARRGRGGRGARYDYTLK